MTHIAPAFDGTELRATTVTEWADALDHTGLRPGPTFGYRMVDGTWNCALHLAISSDLTSDAQRLLAAELQQAISDTVNRALSCTLVSVSVRPDGGHVMTTSLYAFATREDDHGTMQPDEALFTPTPENAAAHGFETRDGIHLTGIGPEDDEEPTEFVALGHGHTWTALAFLADAWMRVRHPDADLPLHTRPPVRKHAVFITHPHPDHPCACAWDGQWRLVYVPATEPGAVAVTVMPAGRAS